MPSRSGKPYSFAQPPPDKSSPLPPAAQIHGAVLGIGRGLAGKVLGVVKAYSTRVGAGPFPTEFRGPLEEKRATKKNKGLLADLLALRDLP